jgi:hypothetical protein
MDKFRRFGLTTRILAQLRQEGFSVRDKDVALMTTKIADVFSKRTSNFRNRLNQE